MEIFLETKASNLNDNFLKAWFDIDNTTLTVCGYVFAHNEDYIPNRAGLSDTSNCNWPKQMGLQCKEVANWQHAVYYNIVRNCYRFTKSINVDWKILKFKKEVVEVECMTTSGGITGLTKQWTEVINIKTFEVAVKDQVEY